MSNWLWKLGLSTQVSVPCRAVVAVLDLYYSPRYLFANFIDICLSVLCYLLSRPLPFSFHSLSGVISVSLSVVLGVEEDQSESAPANARHERGTHYPTLGANQVDQENDWRDHRMSAEQGQVEYLK